MSAGMVSGSGRRSGFAAAGSKARLVLLACCASHLVTDGLITAFYPLLPLIAADLQLSYTAAGSLRAALIGSSSLFQLPAGYLADWVAETTILGAGMLWMSLGFAAMALAAGFWPLLALTLGTGIGGSPQHPLATAIVSRMYDSGGRATAISTLNFAGDMGKALLPALAGLVVLGYGWRGAVLVMGIVGLAVSTGYGLTAWRLGSTTRAPVSREKKVIGGWGIDRPVSFALLSAIAVIDNMTRVGALTFVPFLLTDKGLDAAQVSFLLTLVFAFGAGGKLGCGLLADRFGNVGVVVVTETITALSILAVIPLAPLLLVPVLAIFGFVLNGTSSAITTAVAEIVQLERRARAFGVYFTLYLGLGTFAPMLYGLVADSAGVSTALATMAMVNLTTVPMALLLPRKP